MSTSISVGGLISKTFYWSNDEGATFALLASPDEFVSAKSPRIRGKPFTGNPATKYKDPDAGPKLDEDGVPIEEDEDEEEEEEEEEPAPEEDEVDEDGNPVVRPPPPRRLNELERLSYCVQSIDNATSIVPRGLIYMTATGDLARNPAFEGLSIDESRKLSSYLLLRAPVLPSTLAAIRKAGVTNHHDCLDPIVAPGVGANSKPKGEWALHLSESGVEVSLRSLLYPGFEYTLEAGTAGNFRGGYWGQGERNQDLLFML